MLSARLGRGREGSAFGQIQETTKFSQAFVYSAYPTGWVIGGGGTIPRRETAGPCWEPEERASIFGVHCGALAATIRQCALGRCKELKIWGTFVVTVWIRYIPLDIGRRFVIHN